MCRNPKYDQLPHFTLHLLGRKNTCSLCTSLTWMVVCGHWFVLCYMNYSVDIASKLWSWSQTLFSHMCKKGWLKTRQGWVWSWNTAVVLKMKTCCVHVSYDKQWPHKSVLYNMQWILLQDQGMYINFWQKKCLLMKQPLEGQCLPMALHLVQS